MNKKHAIFETSILLFVTVFSIFFNGINSVKAAKKTDSMKWTITWQGLVCTGTYEGETKDGKPHGEGKFEGDILVNGEGRGNVSYNGSWKNGCLQGSGKLIDTMNSLQYEGEFRKNMLHGKIKIYQEDDLSYIIREYKKDIPCNIAWEYNDDQCAVQDRFYRGMSVNQLQKEAQEIKYQDLLLRSEEFLHHKIKLSGEVIEQSYTNEAYHEVLVMSATGEYYILKYDLDYLATATNYMPFVENGDNIVVYGYSAGTAVAQERQILCPCVEAVSMRWLNKDNFDPKNLRYCYEDFLNYPYEYKEKEIELSGTVIGIQSITDEWIDFFLESDSYSDEKGQYICRVKNTEEWIEQLPKSGEKLSVKGLLDLNCPYEQEDNEYRFCPYVELTEIVE